MTESIEEQIARVKHYAALLSGGKSLTGRSAAAAMKELLESLALLPALSVRENEMTSGSSVGSSESQNETGGPTRISTTTVSAAVGEDAVKWEAALEAAEQILRREVVSECGPEYGLMSSSERAEVRRLNRAIRFFIDRIRALKSKGPKE